MSDSALKPLLGEEVFSVTVSINEGNVSVDIESVGTVRNLPISTKTFITNRYQCDSRRLLRKEDTTKTHKTLQVIQRSPKPYLYCLSSEIGAAKKLLLATLRESLVENIAELQKLLNDRQQALDAVDKAV